MAIPPGRAAALARGPLARFQLTPSTNRVPNPLLGSHGIRSVRYALLPTA